MIRYRPFRNSDPPALCAIWSGQPPQRGLVQPMTPAVLDQLVLSKPYFERQGLIVAVDDEQPVGFAHAGFACSDDQRGLDYTRGAVCLAMAVGAAHREATLAGLLEQTERYLVAQGARTLYGGASKQLAPFYLGIYGGSDLRGVLRSDADQSQMFVGAGYRIDSEAIVLQRELAGFRPLVNRDLIQLRRQCDFRKTTDPPAENWWEASLLAHVERDRFELAPRRTGNPLGSICFWDIEPLASSWGVHAVGLWHLEIGDPPLQTTITTFLLGESMREVQAAGITLVELHVDERDEVLLGACRQLGFREMDRAVLYSKSVV